MFNQSKDDSFPRSIIERSLNKYEIDVMPYGETTSRIDRFTDEIVQMLQAGGATYKEAMQIPAQLKARLSLIFQEQILSDIVRPLSDHRPNQGDK